MTPSLRRKLEALAERREELERLLADPGVLADNDRFRNYSREFAQLEPVVTALAEETKAKRDLVSAEAMRNEDVPTCTFSLKNTGVAADLPAGEVGLDEVGARPGVTVAATAGTAYLIGLTSDHVDDAPVLTTGAVR